MIHSKQSVTSAPQVEFAGQNLNKEQRERAQEPVN